MSEKAPLPITIDNLEYGAVVSIRTATSGYPFSREGSTPEKIYCVVTDPETAKRVLRHPEVRELFPIQTPGISLMTEEQYQEFIQSQAGQREAV